MLPSDDLIQEQAYLISRGVRPLALVGTIETDPDEMLRVYNKLSLVRTGTANGHEPIAVVVARQDGECADVGYAARAWVVDTFRWLSENAPQPHLNRLMGLLLGYSPDAIAALEEAESGALFPGAITAFDEGESDDRQC